VEGRKTTTYATHFIIQDSLAHFSYCFSLVELKPEKGRLLELPSFRVCTKARWFILLTLSTELYILIFLMYNCDNGSIGLMLKVFHSRYHFQAVISQYAVPNHSFLPPHIIPPPELCQYNCLWNCNLNWITQLIWIKNNICFGGDRAWEWATGGRKGPTKMGGGERMRTHSTSLTTKAELLWNCEFILTF